MARSITPSSVNPTPVDALEAPHCSQRETLLTMLSVLLVMLLASLDQTIVGTPRSRRSHDHVL